MDIGVDAVNQLIDFLVSEIAPPPGFGTGLRADFIHGGCQLDGGFVLILDAAPVLSVDEITRLGAEPAACTACAA